MEIDYTGWKFSDELHGLYENEGHHYVRYGIITVPVEKITGLSYRGVLRSEKLNSLAESVEKNGFDLKRHSPNDLNLTLYPNGEYAVGSGGNHRTYLAKKIGLQTITASLDILILENQLSNDEIEILNNLGIFERDDYLKKIVDRLGIIPKL
ncbi:hypothetical protein P5618_015005 [Priestia megaterium]|uniref:hypothetical protein n=1 Tax=Priestia megaterium TaxID=1404 RepID=UPI002452C87C|nr:hypothetical protein [Priestia megaterium]MDH3180944.1 hypothetical protein [Priestia megaterium]